MISAVFQATNIEPLTSAVTNWQPPAFFAGGVPSGSFRNYSLFHRMKSHPVAFGVNKMSHKTIRPDRGLRHNDLATGRFYFV